MGIGAILGFTTLATVPAVPEVSRAPTCASDGNHDGELPPGRASGASATFDGIEYVWVPPGSLQMGSAPGQNGRDSEEGPVHLVAFSNGFWMSRMEVTSAQFCTFLNARGNEIVEDVPWLETNDEDCRIEKQEERFVPQSGYADHPVVETSWWGAKAFAAWANARLPSEAEWEYACRAGTRSTFTTGDCIASEQANFNGEKPLPGCQKGKYRGETSPVGSFAPNAWGLHDMLGNVWEWCEDVWHDSYVGAPTNGDPWVVGGDPNVRVVRGGSWYSIMKTLRSAYRHFTPPDYSSSYTGIRLVRTSSE
jgi:formylglycine-generating enzyme required for sulfatase activity